MKKTLLILIPLVLFLSAQVQAKQIIVYFCNGGANGYEFVSAPYDIVPGSVEGMNCTNPGNKPCAYSAPIVVNGNPHDVNVEALQPVFNNIAMNIDNGSFNLTDGITVTWSTDASGCHTAVIDYP